MNEFIMFIILSIPVIVISRRSLLKIKSHGFYRFFSWECILLLIILNITFWFRDPLSLQQIISWILLIFSLYLVIAGVIQMKKSGMSTMDREESELYGFEKTSKLVETGIFKYIRHPLYSSLLFFTWGAFLKDITLLTVSLAILSSIFLYLTSRMDEIECINFFGEEYRDYMKRTSMFVPFLI